MVTEERLDLDSVAEDSSDDLSLIEIATKDALVELKAKHAIQEASFLAAQTAALDAFANRQYSELQTMLFAQSMAQDTLVMERFQALIAHRMRGGAPAHPTDDDAISINRGGAQVN